MDEEEKAARLKIIQEIRDIILRGRVEQKGFIAYVNNYLNPSLRIETGRRGANQQKVHASDISPVLFKGEKPDDSLLEKLGPGVLKQIKTAAENLVPTPLRQKFSYAGTAEERHNEVRDLALRLRVSAEQILGYRAWVNDGHAGRDNKIYSANPKGFSVEVIQVFLGEVTLPSKKSGIERRIMFLLNHMEKHGQEYLEAGTHNGGAPTPS